MSATLTTLRPGETIKVRATPVNSDGTSPGPLSATSWTCGAHTSVVADSGDPYLANLTGLTSTNGAAATVAFEGQDEFSSSHADSAAVVVLNASKFEFSPPVLLLTPGATMGEWVGVYVTAIGADVRGPAPRSYPYGPGSPPTGIHDVVWTSANGSVLFDGPLWGIPPGTPTAADTMAVEVWPDLTDGNSEPTTDTIILTGKNSNGDVITGTLPVTIRRVASVVVEQVP